MVTKTQYHKIRSYTTKDGSLIRELMHPDRDGNTRQSLAEAVVALGSLTLLHKHIRSEEIYHITAGTGLMTLGDKQFKVVVGDTVYIPPGIPHQIKNIGEIQLKLFCCSSPPYSHDDTELLTQFSAFDDERG